MRPKTIIAFEWISLSMLLVGIVHSIATWEESIAMSSPGFVITVQAFSIGVALALILWVSRGRSNVAKWINVALFVLGLPVMIVLFGSEQMTGSSLVTLAQTVIQMIALGLLFTPSAREWLSKSAPASAVLKQTFE